MIMTYSRKTGIITVLLLLMAILPLQAKEWTADDIPMVHLQDARRYVCDPEGIMSQTLRDSTDMYLKRLEQEKGVQSVFVVVNHVENADAFRIAQDIGNRQGVGNKETNRGLVVVIAVQDRKYFIAPGSGLEAELTDMECGRIGRACIVQNMRIGNTDNAVLFTAKAVYNRVAKGDSRLGDEEEDDGLFIVLFIFLVILMAFTFWGFFDKILRKVFGIQIPQDTTHTRKRPPFIILDDFHDFGSNSHINIGGGGFGGGSFGGGSFGGGGAGGGW
jgi:uncharacterized protein